MHVRAGVTLLMWLAIALPRVETSQGETSFPARLERYMTDTVKLTAGRAPAADARRSDHAPARRR